jgi:two-component system, chemotaxis family, protein-glutamate methylesterase/glutaminase
MATVRVLVVENDAVLRGRLVRMFQDHTRTRVVAWTADGADVVGAISEATKTEGGVDVVFMAESMPVMGGVAATRALRERYPRLPVVLWRDEGRAGGDAGFDAGVTAEVGRHSPARELVNVTVEAAGIQHLGARGEG